MRCYEAMAGELCSYGHADELTEWDLWKASILLMADGGRSTDLVDYYLRNEKERVKWQRRAGTHAQDFTISAVPRASLVS